MDPVTNMPIVILKDIGSNTILPIWVGVYEANAIALEIEKVSTPRPMTHDLIKQVLQGLHTGVRKVVVNELKDDTFYAIIWLEKDGELITVDSRPSDRAGAGVAPGLPDLRGRSSAEVVEDGDHCHRQSEQRRTAPLAGRAGRRGPRPLQNVGMQEIFERLVAANIQIMPIPGIENHFVFERDGFIALVSRTPEGAFGRIGSSGLLTEKGFAALTWRGGHAYFVAKGFEQAAAEGQVDRLRAFQHDLKAALNKLNPEFTFPAKHPPRFRVLACRRTEMKQNMEHRRSKAIVVMAVVVVGLLQRACGHAYATGRGDVPVLPLLGGLRPIGSEAEVVGTDCLQLCAGGR